MTISLARRSSWIALIVGTSLITGAAHRGPATRTQQAEYQVALVLTGYSGLVEAWPDCAVDTAGTDSLVGNLTGHEPGVSDEEVVYTGTFRRATKIDFCEVRGKKGPNDDEKVYCVVTLTGTATMKATLTVYGEADRGAWLKAVVDKTKPSTSNVHGDCDPADTNIIQQEYPGSDHGGGGSPNGQPIEDKFSTIKFFDHGTARLRKGYYPPDPKQTSWALDVIAKIR